MGVVARPASPRHGDVAVNAAVRRDGLTLVARSGLAEYRGFQRCQAGQQIFSFVVFDPSPDCGGQGPGERDVNCGVDAVNAGELVEHLFWGHPGCWRAHDPAVMDTRASFIAHVSDIEAGCGVERGRLARVSCLFCALGDAHASVIGADIWWNVLYYHGPAVVADRELRLEAQLGGMARGECGEVAGDRAAGDEVRRADDVDDCLPGRFRVPDDVADCLDDS